MAFAADGRGIPWKLLWFDVRGICRGNSRGVPWQLPRIAMALAVEGLPWQLPWNAVAFAVDCRGLPRHLTWRWPWNMPWQLTCYFRGFYGWYHGGCHGQNRGTFHGRNRGTCRGSAMYNRNPWSLPWKPADFHGSRWQDPRKTTEVPRSLPRTPTEKLNNVHLCPVVYGDKKNRYTLYLVYR